VPEGAQRAERQFLEALVRIHRAEEVLTRVHPGGSTGVNEITATAAVDAIAASPKVAETLPGGRGKPGSATLLRRSISPNPASTLTSPRSRAAHSQ
jgi:hypothetical protein